jgi:hypothetical protein
MFWHVGDGAYQEVQRDRCRNERARPAVRIAFAPAVFGMIREATAPAGSASASILFLTAAALAYWAGRIAVNT